MTTTVSSQVIRRPASRGPQALDRDRGVEQLHAVSASVRAAAVPGPAAARPGTALDQGFSLNQNRLRSESPYFLSTALTKPLARSSASAAV